MNVLSTPSFTTRLRDRPAARCGGSGLRHGHGTGAAPARHAVLDEDCDDARWNIPTTLDATLVTTDDACCAQPRPRCPEGECVVLTHLCNDLVSTIGGNTGAPTAPVGYRHPGAISTAGDRPYAGVVPVEGVCADWMDYYSPRL